MSIVISSREVRFEWPELRLPLFLIVDDPAPCLNLAHYEQYFEPHVRDVPNSFTSGWADLIEEFGVRGKFSILPVPAGIGRIDRPLPDVKPADQAEFLRIARERISPQMDICIEFLTHYFVWDIRRERTLDYTEKTMGPFTSRAQLTEYFAYGLKILHDLGLNPTGATSPGIACRDIEWEYQNAIRHAIKDVTGRPIAWYFLHVDDRSPVVLPRIMSIDPHKAEACVTMVSAGNDPCWQTQRGDPSTLDILITEDGQSGRLVELYRNGSVIGFHTHWQSLFSEGRATGLKDFRTLFGRIRDYLEPGARWTKCSELANIVTAQALTNLEVQGENPISVRLSCPIACPNFTVTVHVGREIRDVKAGNTELHRLPNGARTLQPNTWRQNGSEIAWCADLLPPGLTVELTL